MGDASIARGFRLSGGLLAALAVASCATAPTKFPVVAATGAGRPPGEGGAYVLGAPYRVGAIQYVPREQPNYDQTGLASWYGDDFHMQATANGERFDRNAVTAAHATLPLPSIVEVTNLDNRKTLRVRVNDRGPFAGGRIIDLSHEAARQLGFDRRGLARVRVRYLGPAVMWEEDTRRHDAETGRRYAERRDAAGPARAAAEASTVEAPPIATALASARPPATLPVALRPWSPLADRLALRPSQPVQGVFRIQAGAFSTLVRAQHAVILLAAAGPAAIEPVQLHGLTLYRVILRTSGDAVGARTLRDQVANIGFPDARVTHAF